MSTRGQPSLLVWTHGGRCRCTVPPVSVSAPWAALVVHPLRKALGSIGCDRQARGHLDQLVGGLFEGSRSKPGPRLAGSTKPTARKRVYEVRPPRHPKSSRGFILRSGAWRGVANLSQQVGSPFEESRSKPEPRLAGTRCDSS
jgi:hypothetical protein